MNGTPRRRPGKRFGRLVLVSAAAVALVAIGGATSAGSTTGAQTFNHVVLPGGDGAEPSLAVDTSPTSSRGYVYVSAIGDSNGPLEWYSYNHGGSWSQPVPFDLNGPLRGGDSDIAVNTNGNVLAADLNVSWASVQISTNHGKSFDAGTQSAPEDDRPWLTANGQDVYVSYHDFVAEDPIVCTSHDGGKSFPACTQAFAADPSVTNCAENTIPARGMSIDPTDYSLNFLYSCSTAAENLQHPPYGPLHDYYLAKSTDGGLTWTTYPVFKGDTSGGKAPNYANIFGSLAIDSQGNYYALFGGTADDNHVLSHPYHVYLSVSKNHGRTWRSPLRIDNDANGAGTHVLAHLAVTTPGNVDVVWYGSTYTGEPNGVCGTLLNQSQCANGFPPYTASNAPGWRVYMAQSLNALSTTPTFTQVVVNPNYTHFGRICTNGLVCGGSDRSLLDFISVAVDCSGYAHIAYGGNTKAQETAGHTYVHVSNQTGGTPIARPAACR
jgi:hypothetical protein